jgi:hypothetical protein
MVFASDTTWVPSDSSLLLLKYAASTMTAAYGVYATVTDFKVGPEGHKVLTKKGKWGIALFLFSVLITVSSDGLKDIRDQKKAEQDATRQAQAASDERFVTQSLQQQLNDTKALNEQLKNARTKLDQTANTAASTLNAALRSVDPFVPDDVVSFVASFDIALDQSPVEAYLERVKTNKPGSREEIYPPGAGNDTEFKVESPGYPNDRIAAEEPLADLVKTSTIKVSVRKQGERPISYTADLQCDPSKSLVYYHGANTQKAKDSMGWLCLGTKIEWNDSTGSIRSYRDLVGADATVEASGFFSFPWLKYSMDEIIFSTKTGREFKVVRSRKCKLVNDMLSLYSQVCPGVLSIHGEHFPGK